MEHDILFFEQVSTLGSEDRVVFQYILEGDFFKEFNIEVSFNDKTTKVTFLE
jgi:hypothetical protein